MFNEGISEEGDLIDIGVDQGVVKKSGSFYSFGDIRLGQGRENSKNFMRENPELTAEIRSLILEKTALAPADRNGHAAFSEDDQVVLVAEEDSN
jgi:recombination protein RecA